MAVEYYLISTARRLHRLLPERAYVFGRDEKADIQINDQLISRRHAELRFTAPQWRLKDLGSRNGVLVNGRRIREEEVLKDGSVIQVGGQRFCLCLVPPGADPRTLLERTPRIGDEETMAPDFKVEDIIAQGAHCRGVVDKGGLIDLLQFFQVTTGTGRLDLTGTTRLAAVWFAQGVPVHAFHGTLLGLPALISLARTPPTQFAFHANAPPPDRHTLQGGLQAVLMEIARALDEDRRNTSGR